MKDTHTDRHEPPVLTCASCGTLITAKPYAQQAEGYCCEHCFLKAREDYARQSDACTLLAETLVGALDLREHETGLHSKRVACHTLVLARHVGFGAEELRQIYWARCCTKSIFSKASYSRVSCSFGPIVRTLIGNFYNSTTC